MKLYFAADVKACDEYAIGELGYPSVVLMEHAARSVFDEIAGRFPDFTDYRFVILYGNGNNGGDALALARMLFLSGAGIKLVEAVSAPKTPDARLEMKLLKAASSGCERIEFVRKRDIEKFVDEKTIIIDGVFGTGFRSELPGDVKVLFDRVRSALHVVAIDIPSGVNPDNGEVMDGTLAASLTVTFMLPKVGLYAAPASLYCGEIAVKGIMSPVKKIESSMHLVTRELIAELLKKYSRKSDSHKGNFGHVGVIAPEHGMEGAVALCAEAALKSGCGLVTVLGINEDTDSVRGRMPMICPEVMLYGVDIDEDTGNELKKHFSRFSSLVVGPGYGKKRALFLSKILEHLDLPVIVDADAINIMSEHRDLIRIAGTKKVILTPHPGEMSRLSQLEKIQEHRLDALRNFADVSNLDILLKGYRSMLYCREGGLFINPTGNPALSKAGSGDVLSGILASFTAQGMKTWEAAVTAMFVHGMCADNLVRTKSDLSVNPSDVINEIGNVLLCLKK